MGRMEKCNTARGHVRVRSDDGPHGVRFQRCRGNAVARRDPRERAQIVIDDRLAQ